MGLYRYNVAIRGGEPKTGLITAKTEAEARERLAKQLSIVEWHSLEVEPPHASVVASKPTKAKTLTKLQKMLYLQSGRCFFCGQPLREEDATIEHLNPRSKGGTSTEDNEVVCHATLNDTFGNMDLKRKFEFSLKAAGSFKCPSR